MEIKTMAKLRAWGNSIGIVLPKEELKKENMKVNDEVEIVIKKKVNPLREAFGKLKFTKSTEKILKEVDEELKSKFD